VFVKSISCWPGATPACTSSTFLSYLYRKLFAMKYSIIIIFLTLQVSGNAQVKVVNLDKEDPNRAGNSTFFMAGGIPVSSAKYVRVVSGTPYFSESWMKGKAILSGGKICDSLRLRVDLLANELQYKSNDGAEMVASTPLRSIILTDSVAGKEHFFVYSEFMSPAPPEAGWYQLLTAGNATLYKRINKKVMESKAYGSSLTEQNIVTTEQYYVLTNGVYTKIKKMKELPEVLANKSTDLSSYISSRKLSGKSEQDFIDVVAQYNTLLQK
jgi:hypothetical protein